MADEKLGIDQLEKIVDAAGEGVNVGYRLAHGGGILSALSAMDEISALGTVSKDAALSQLKDLDKDERAKLRERFKNKVSIDNKELESKIEGGADDLEDLISLGYEQYELFLKEKALVERIIAKFKKQP